MRFRRSFEMTITRDEFLRVLPSVLEPYVVEWEPGGDGLYWSDGACRGSVRVARLEDRFLGRLHLPRVRVEIDIEGGPDGLGQAFLERFHRAFLRAGG